MSKGFGKPKDDRSKTKAGRIRAGDGLLETEFEPYFQSLTAAFRSRKVSQINQVLCQIRDAYDAAVMQRLTKLAIGTDITAVTFWQQKLEEVQAQGGNAVKVPEDATEDDPLTRLLLQELNADRQKVISVFGKNREEVLRKIPAGYTVQEFVENPEEYSEPGVAAIAIRH